MNTLDKLYLSAQIRARVMKDNVKKFMTEEQLKAKYPMDLNPKNRKRNATPILYGIVEERRASLPSQKNR